MEINSIHGIQAYTTARPAEENITAQNREALQSGSNPDSNRDSSQVAQQAFEVTITEAARAQQAAQTQSSEQPVENLPAAPPRPQQEDQQQTQAAGQQSQAAPIVDIVA